MVTLLTTLLRLIESLLLAAGVLFMIYLYQRGGTALLRAGALPTYAILGAIYLLFGLIFKGLVDLCLQVRRKRDRARRNQLQANIDAGLYDDIRPGTAWQHTRFGNSVAR